MSEGLANSKISVNAFEPIQGMESDELGRSGFARQISDRVSDPDCPTAVGLYGGWGTGKTSILNLMRAFNKQQGERGGETPLIEYIDVWPYEISGDLAVPLLIRMRKLIGNIPPANYAKNFRRVLGVLAQAGTDILLRKLLDLELSDVEGYIENLNDVAPDKINLRDLETLVDNIEGAQESFQELAQLAREARGKRRIVFLIDNLDRCSPENVVRLLESVKNFLYAPHCVWIFAMDAGVIASYIDRKYEGTKMDGNSYLDKIIPEQFHIPPITGIDANRLQRFLSKAAPARQAGLPVIETEKIPNLPEVLVPRRLLKTAHRFYRAHTHSKLGAPADPDTIFALILLYNSWPLFYERSSSESPEHVRGILENFIPKGQPDPKPIPRVIPISDNFLQDRSLTHYIRHCFIKGKNPDVLYETLARSMAWLRKAGLP